MIDSGAVFDSSGTYRYLLWRVWSGDAPRVAFVMLNPSAADAAANDPTIRRCIGLARAWGYGALEVVNLFAYRTAYPAELGNAGDPIGPENDRYIRAALVRCAAVIAAWGVHGSLRQRGAQVSEMLRALAGGTACCLGRTRAGHPRHPLYLSNRIVPQPFFNSSATM